MSIAGEAAEEEDIPAVVAAEPAAAAAGSCKPSTAPASLAASVGEEWPLVEGRVGEEAALPLPPPPPPTPAGVGDEAPHEAPATLNGARCACDLFRGPPPAPPPSNAFDEGLLTLRRAATYAGVACTVAMVDDAGACRFGLGVREWLGELRLGTGGPVRLGCLDRSPLSSSNPPPTAFRRERP